MKTNIYISSSLILSEPVSLAAIASKPVEKIGEVFGIGVYIDYTLPDGCFGLVDKDFNVLRRAHGSF